MFIVVYISLSQRRSNCKSFNNYQNSKKKHFIKQES